MSRRRRRLVPTEQWQQLELLCHFPEQRTYELIRPVVLFGQSAAERAQQTGVSERSIYRKAELFERRGFTQLGATWTVGQRGRLPAVLRLAIVELKAEYAALNAREIARICYIRFGRRPSHHTVEQVLTEDAALVPGRRRFPPYAQIPNGAQRRLAIIHLHVEGWTVSSIAGYLECSRPTVYQALARWKAELFADLEDHPHTRQRRVLKTTLQVVETIRSLQRNPELGEFRIHAALQQLGIVLSPRTCGRILAVNRALYGLGKAPRRRSSLPPQAMPFKARRRHQYWTVDLRYLDHHLGGGNIYGISILDNYSRAVLASGVFRTQDTATFLLVLRAAVAQYGSPEHLVSDSGGIFLAKQAQAIYTALGLEKIQIERGEPWQSYIETTFNIQRRMADWHFAQAGTWAELLEVHERWLADYNQQVHWAHRERRDGRRTPLEVLGWLQGTLHDTATLEQIFGRLRFGRRLDLSGYARFRRWRLYGERGLARQPAAIWLSGEYLTIEFADEPVAQYVVRYGGNAQELRKVVVLRLFETRYRSPQPFLWELGPEEWLTVIRLPTRSYRRRRHSPIVQAALLPAAGEESTG